MQSRTAPYVDLVNIKDIASMAIVMLATRTGKQQRTIFSNEDAKAQVQVGEALSHSRQHVGPAGEDDHLCSEDAVALEVEPPQPQHAGEPRERQRARAVRELEFSQHCQRLNGAVVGPSKVGTCTRPRSAVD
jgi:hypothetical protein